METTTTTTAAILFDCKLCRQKHSNLAALHKNRPLLDKNSLRCWLKELNQCVYDIIASLSDDNDDDVDGSITFCHHCTHTLQEISSLQVALLSKLSSIRSPVKIFTQVSRDCDEPGQPEVTGNDLDDPGSHSHRVKEPPFDPATTLEMGTSRTSRNESKIEQNFSAIASCRFCRRAFYDLETPHRHKCRRKTASRTPKTDYFCSRCQQTFTLKSNMARHCRNVHGELGASAQCEICLRFFRSHCHLRRHLRTVHENPTTRWRCNQCGRCFKRSDHLRAHVAAVHSLFRPHVCATCLRAFTRADSLADHVRIHTGQRPHVCDICGADFRERRAFMRHKRLCCVGIVDDKGEKSANDLNSDQNGDGESISACIADVSRNSIISYCDTAAIKQSNGCHGDGFSECNDVTQPANELSIVFVDGQERSIETDSVL